MGVKEDIAKRVNAAEQAAVQFVAAKRAAFGAPQQQQQELAAAQAKLVSAIRNISDYLSNNSSKLSNKDEAYMNAHLIKYNAILQQPFEDPKPKMVAELRALYQSTAVSEDKTRYKLNATDLAGVQEAIDGCEVAIYGQTFSDRRTHCSKLESQAYQPAKGQSQEKIFDEYAKARASYTADMADVKQLGGISECLDRVNQTIAKQATALHQDPVKLRLLQAEQSGLQALQTAAREQSVERFADSTREKIDLTQVSRQQMVTFATDLAPAGLVGFLQSQLGPGDTVSPLSFTNNKVCQVTNGSDSIVVKFVEIDASLHNANANYLADENRELLNGRHDFTKTYHAQAFPSDTNKKYIAVEISEYVNAPSLPEYFKRQTMHFPAQDAMPASLVLSQQQSVLSVVKLMIQDTISENAEGIHYPDKKLGNYFLTQEGLKRSDKKSAIISAKPLSKMGGLEKFNPDTTYGQKHGQDLAAIDKTSIAVAMLQAITISPHNQEHQLTPVRSGLTTKLLPQNDPVWQQPMLSNSVGQSMQNIARNMMENPKYSLEQALSDVEKTLNVVNNSLEHEFQDAAEDTVSNASTATASTSDPAPISERMRAQADDLRATAHVSTTVDAADETTELQRPSHS